MADLADAALPHYCNSYYETPGTNLSDGDTETSIYGFSVAAIDLGSPKRLQYFRLFIINGTTAIVEMNGNYFQGSNNSTNGIDGDWTTLHTFNLPAQAGWTPDLDLSNENAYRWYRIYAPNTVVSPGNREVCEWYLPEYTMPLGVLTLAGYNPSTMGGISRAFIPASTLILTIHNPSTSTGFTVQIPAGRITLQSYALATSAAVAAVIPLGIISITKHNPSYRWDPIIIHRLQTIYQCILTGSADSLSDLIIPMASFQSILRQGEIVFVPGWSMLNWCLAWGWAVYPLLTELSCVIPNSTLYIEDIAARTHGDIVIKKGYRSSDGSINVQEICRATYEALQIGRGARSDSATISGHKTTVLPDRVDRVLSGVTSYEINTEGRRVLRAAPDLFLRVGGAIAAVAGNDIVITQDNPMTVGQLSYTVNTSQDNMEVTEAAEPAAITWPADPPTWDEFYAYWGEGADPLDHRVPYGM